ncbi:MAG: HD-GYP domain-containing protein [bacterium]|nr:HD-GYP domain-containing protein [bacterium]
MSELQQSLSAESIRYLRDRIGDRVRICGSAEPWPIGDLLQAAGLPHRREETQRIASAVSEMRLRAGIHALQIDDCHCLVVAPLPDLEARDLYLLALISGDATLARGLVSNAIESWTLHSQVKLSQAALDESAAQLAQSFEEQDWLREFARNATTFTKVTAANQAADGILQPLSYLLRAQDVFLIVFPEETRRSGLVSSRYGHSQFSIADISQLLKELQFTGESAPLVRNHLARPVDNGTIDSLVAVVVSDVKSARGFLVAVNRSLDPGHPGLPTEFGSGDVALLEEAAALLTTQAQNMHLLLQSNELFLGTLLAMSSAIDARDPYTQGHSERVARLSYELAQILGLSEAACQEIYLSGILHDIGKIGIPDSVLLKAGHLDDKEFAVIRQHPEIGYRMVQRLGHLHFTLPGILYHHERWDGKGYPHGLQGLSIPLMARIIAVADGYDAMTSSRPYRQAMDPDRAHAIICEGAQSQWDAEIVECFTRWYQRREGRQPTTATADNPIAYQAPSDQLMQAVMTLIQ